MRRPVAQGTGDPKVCGLCGEPVNLPDRPETKDYHGYCWGCVLVIEAALEGQDEDLEDDDR